MSYVTMETLQQRLEEATVSLLSMARNMSWNKISDNCFYIISKEEVSGYLSFEEERKLRKKTNDKKLPEELYALMPTLNELYSDIAEFNLFVYRAERTKTIIEISYYPLQQPESPIKHTIKKHSPGLHCKVAMPNYANGVSGKNKKFNINWQLNPPDHVLKVFWTRLRYKYNKHVRKIYS